MEVGMAKLSEIPFQSLPGKRGLLHHDADHEQETADICCLTLQDFIKQTIFSIYKKGCMLSRACKAMDIDLQINLELQDLQL